MEPLNHLTTRNFSRTVTIIMSGDKFKAEAEKLKAHKGGLLGSIFGAGKGKQEEAGEMYTKAGNAYKFEKRWSDAGECYAAAGDCHLKAEGSVNDACTSFVEAANAFKQVCGDVALTPYPCCSR